MMARRHELEIEQVVTALRATPAAIREASRFVEHLQAMQARFQELHWGREQATGRRPFYPAAAPDASEGAIELGHLAEIGYLTRKGRDREPVLYVHRFETPRGRIDDLPILCEAANGSGLVIVRGRSRYTVTGHGIEG